MNNFEGLEILPRLSFSAKLTDYSGQMMILWEEYRVVDILREKNLMCKSYDWKTPKRRDLGNTRVVWRCVSTNEPYCLAHALATTIWWIWVIDCEHYIILRCKKYEFVCIISFLAHLKRDSFYTLLDKKTFLSTNLLFDNRVYNIGMRLKRKRNVGGQFRKYFFFDFRPHLSNIQQLDPRREESKRHETYRSVKKQRQGTTKKKKISFFFIVFFVLGFSCNKLCEAVAREDPTVVLVPGKASLDLRDRPRDQTSILRGGLRPVVVADVLIILCL